MKKYLSILAILLVISPSIAFASWWNPFSWSIFHRIDKTKVLENRIQELEKKLESASSTTKTYEQVITEQKKKADEINSKLSGTTTPKTYEQVISEAQTRAATVNNQINKTPSPVPSTPSIPSTVVGLKPKIVSFTVTPSTVTQGEIVTFSWNTENAVSCAVPVLNPSTLSVPFTGRLPNGEINYTIPITGLTQDRDYWIVCADKDWNTTTSKIAIHSIGPHISGNPYTHYNSQGNRVLSLTIDGANSAQLTCFNGNYQSSNPPKIVNSVLTADKISHQISANISSEAWPGTLLQCTIEFGNISNSEAFSTYNIKEEFTTYAP